MNTLNNAGARCPSCGRFVGPLDACPYCGASVQKRLPLGALKIACLVLAVLGVAILLVAVRNADTPITKIGAVGATMNYAYVRVQGTVTRGPLYDADTQTLRFYLSDETGEMQAVSFRETTQDLIQAKQIPTIGDKINLEGTLRIRDDFTTLNLVSADKLQITAPSPDDVKMSDILPGDDLHYVRIKGDVRAIRQPYQGLTVITLGDTSGELDVAVTSDIEKLYGAVPTVALGDIVQAQGVVASVHDSPEVMLRQSGDFKKLDTPNTAANLSKISALDASHVNQRVQLAGTLTSLTKFSQGERATLSDETGDITLVLWQDLLSQFHDTPLLQKGAQVRVVGKLSQYRGALELAPDAPSDLIVAPAVPTPFANTISAVTPQATPTAHPTRTPYPTRKPTVILEPRTIQSITTSDLGQTALLEGTITKITDFSKGKYVTLQDATGTIQITLFDDNLAAVLNKLSVGAHVRTRGKVNVFRGALEIVADQFVIQSAGQSN